MSADALQNLDFEQANTNSVTLDPGTGSASGPMKDLLPGWSIVTSSGGATNILTRLPYNPSPAGAAGVSLISYDPYPLPTPKIGMYSLLIDLPSGSEVALLQEGLVPIGTDYRELKMVAPLALMPGATIIPNIDGRIPIWLSVTSWDTSGYAGQAVEFRLNLRGPVQGRIDGFFFVPEARPLRLMLLGFATVAGWLLLTRGSYVRKGGRS